VKLLRTIALVRLALLPLALLQLLLNSSEFPSGYRAFAWEVLVLHALVAGGLLFLVHRARGQLRTLALVTLVADAVLISALVLVYSWEPVQPVRSLLFLVVLEAALFFHLRGGLIAAAFTVPVLVLAEVVQGVDIGGGIQMEPIVLRGLIAFAVGAGVGRLVELERGEARLALARARRNAFATTSAAGSICSRRRIALHARSARRSTSMRRSAPSRKSCAACCRSIARPSSCSRTTRSA
jgi:hypothetical protein